MTSKRVTLEFVDSEEAVRFVEALVPADGTASVADVDPQYGFMGDYKSFDVKVVSGPED